MSDLAPFVASVLYDKVLAEMKQEVDRLSEQITKARVVQIVSASGTVYAEGQFKDGRREIQIFGLSASQSSLHRARYLICSMYKSA
jgi:hypothetical protein